MALFITVKNLEQYEYHYSRMDVLLWYINRTDYYTVKKQTTARSTNMNATVWMCLVSHGAEPLRCGLLSNQAFGGTALEIRVFVGPLLVLVRMGCYKNKKKQDCPLSGVWLPVQISPSDKHSCQFLKCGCLI